MTFLVERLAVLRKHVEHLRELKPRVRDRTSLESDLSLHNDVLYSLLMVSQLVIDIAGELSARRGDRFESYGDAIRNLGRVPPLSASIVAAHQLRARNHVPGHLTLKVPFARRR